MAPRLTQDEAVALLDEISNWGRWGKHDERGALNFITPACGAAAAGLVRTGEAVWLALPLATEWAADNPAPVTHLMERVGHDTGRRAYSADYFAIVPHSHSATHLDALCHRFLSRQDVQRIQPKRGRLARRQEVRD
jgi:hypothetical protein